MELKITKEPMENRQLAVTIEVDQARVDQELKKAARKLANQYRIPGFRKGKAPYQIIVKYIGMPALYQEFVDDLGQEAYQQALDQEAFEPYAQASLQDVSFEPLQFKLVVPIDPEIKLGDYRSLRMEEQKPSVDDAAVAAQLQRYQQQYAGWAPATRPSEYGDLISIDVRSVIVDEAGNPVLDAETGAEQVVLEEMDWDVTPDQENPMEIPGFDEALLGLSAGEEKEIVLSWPAESQSVHAGKSARFKIKVNEVQAHENAELNDDLAKLIGPDFETLDDLKSTIHKNLLAQAEQQAENDYLDQVLTALVAQSTLNYPPVVIEDQIDAMMNDFAQQLRRFGVESLEEYLTSIGQDVAEFRENQRDEATRIAERNLVLSELLTAEKIRVEEDEIKARIDEMVSNADGENARVLRSTFDNPSGHAIFQSQLLHEKAIERVLAIARGAEIPEPQADATEPTTETAPEESPVLANGATVTEETAITESDGAEGAAFAAAEAATEAQTEKPA